MSTNKVYIIGGHNVYPSLLKQVYDYKRSCLLIDLSSGIITKKAPMITGRYFHGVSCISNKIYAVAGIDRSVAVRSTELYDMFTDKWCKIAQFDEYVYGVSTVV